MNRKTAAICTLLFLTIALLNADDFSDILQDLAVQTACIGMYSATQAGGGWEDDPFDYYTPPMMAERFKRMSGNRTRTETFYGVCFDYAEAAYRDIQNYKSLYNDAGMYESQFFLAGVYSNPNVITLSRPTGREGATMIQNGVYVRTYGDSSYRQVKTHKHLNGTRATHHAWLWVQRTDGVWFWIDPTWTDNLGYVVWGYVANGEEVQLRPDERFCVNYPAYLNDLPDPPRMGRRKSPPRNSRSASTAGGGGSGSYHPSYSLSLFEPGDIVCILSAGVLSCLDTDELKEDGIDPGYSVSLEAGNAFRFPVMIQADWAKGADDIEVLLLGGNMGVQFFPWFALYGGAGVGWKSTEGWDGFFDGIPTEWKVNGGFRLTFDKIPCRLEVSYISSIGVTMGVFFGLPIM